MDRALLVGSLFVLCGSLGSVAAAQAPPEVGASLATPPSEEAAHADRWMGALVEKGGGGSNWFLSLISTGLYGTYTVTFGAIGLEGDDGALLAAGGSLVLWSGYLIAELAMPLPSAADVEARYRWLPPDRRRAFVARFLRERESTWRTRGELMLAMQTVGGLMSLAGGLVMAEAGGTENDQHRAMVAMTVGGAALFGAAMLGLLLALADGPLDSFSSERFGAGEEPELP